MRAVTRVSLLLLIVLSPPLVLVFCSSAWAQVAPIPPPFPPERPPLPETPLPPMPPPALLPPPPPPSKPERFPGLKVFVREVRMIGSTVLTQEDLTKIAAPYVNRELTSEDLEALRLALTLAYVNKGYVTSGAIIPDQSVTGGVITFQISEGVLSGIEVEGNEWFRARYIQDRLALGAQPPVNIVALQERLQLLQQDDRIQRLNAELKPGAQTGESILKVKMAEASPYKMWLEFNNFQSPSVGAERGLVTVAHQNLTGNGDPLSFQYGKSTGVDPQIDTRYTLPLNAHDTTIAFEYRKNNFNVVTPPFNQGAVEVKSKSEIYGITVRQPVYRTLNQEVALAMTAERESNQTFLGGEPFSLSAGVPADGKSIISALRFTQEWLYRTANQVVAANSRFSLGIDAFNATIADHPSTNNVPDGRFWAWLGQFQWARRVDPWNIQLIGRVALQYANDRLFPLEQFSVGGRFSVRGYRENTLVRDNALLASLEVRIPVVRSAAGADIVSLAPFLDFGQAWAAKEPTPDPDALVSVGMGLLCNLAPAIPGSRLEVYWGQQLNHVPHSPQESKNMQDVGIHLQFVTEVY